MASLPADRTKLALAQGNQVPSAVASSTKNINATTEAYDTIDLLNAKVDTHAAAATLPHADGSVVTSKLANLGVTTPKIAPLAITSDKIAIGAVGVAQLSPAAAVNETVNNALIVALKADVTQRAINIKSSPYNAVASDATVDNSLIIQAANDALALSGGGTIIVPAGTFYCKTGFSLSSNVRLVGTSKASILKVASTAGGFYSLIQINNVENVSVEGLTIDMNSLGNVVNIGGGAGQSRNQAIYIAGTNSASPTNGIRIIDCEILSGGTWAISAQGQYCEDIWICRNVIDFIYGYSTTAPFYDNTVIYLDCLRFWVIENKIRSTDIGNAATGIEAHFGNGFVVGNLVNGFNTGIIVTSNSYTGDNDTNNIVSGNQIKKALTGITLWPNIDNPLQNVIVSNNIIQLNQATRSTSTQAYGINNKLWTSLNNRYTTKNVKIVGNLISFEADSRVFGSADYVYNFTGISMIPYNLLENVVIEDNEIVDAPATGITLGSRTQGGFTNYVKGCSLKGNTIINAGKNLNIPCAFNEFRCAISTTGNIQNSIIGINHIIDTKLDGGAYFARPVQHWASFVTSRFSKQAIACKEMGKYNYDFPRSTDSNSYEGEGRKSLVIVDMVNEKWHIQQNDIITNLTHIMRSTGSTQVTTGATTGITVNGTNGAKVLTFSDTSLLSLFDTFKIDVDSRVYTVAGIDGNLVYLDISLNTDKVSLGITFNAGTYTNLV